LTEILNVFSETTYMMELLHGRELCDPV
jgi:hypothetical protein